MLFEPAFGLEESWSVTDVDFDDAAPMTRKVGRTVALTRQPLIELAAKVEEVPPPDVRRQ